MSELTARAEWLLTGRNDDHEGVREICLQLLGALKANEDAWRRADREFPGLAKCLIGTGRRIETHAKSADEAEDIALLLWRNLRRTDFKTPPGEALRTAQRAVAEYRKSKGAIRAQMKTTKQ